MPVVDLADVQGLILRGYTRPAARYLGLTVREPRAARAFLGALVSNDPTALSVTTAQRWEAKPQCCVNLGITFPGLAALGVSPVSLDSFPAEYAQGAAQRAAKVGDIGTSRPQLWLPWLADSAPHLLVMLFAESSDTLDLATKQLEQAWSPGCVERGRHEGTWLPGTATHFGYRDGLAQPVIADVPLSGLPDHLPRAPVGEFLLGYPSQHVGFSYPVPAPPELGINGSFAAFRVLEQDVDAFAEFVDQQASANGVSKELIEAKLCGRWPNGTPLVLSPDTDTPDPPIPPDALNDFDYEGDERGYRCPIGSHIRRMYPRGQRVAGNGGHLHRIFGAASPTVHPMIRHTRGTGRNADCSACSSE